MACFVSLTFSIPLCSLQIPFEGKYAKESAFCRFPGLKTNTKTGLDTNVYVRMHTGIARKTKNQSNIGVENKIKLALYSLAPCISNKCICSFNGEHEHHWNTPTKHFEDIDPCSLNVSSCTQMTIIGYWVGPDIDDGWGFVEAFIHQNN